VAEEPRTEDAEEDEKPLLPVLRQPDELRWWELQLGFALPVLGGSGTNSSPSTRA